MVYNKRHRTYGDGTDGVWRCPFPREWVEQMKHAAEVCKWLTAEQIEGVYKRETSLYRLPPGEFLSYDQDARGLPIGYGNDGGRNVSCDIYDYDSIPDLVVTNGEYDRPFKARNRVLTA